MGARTALAWLVAAAVFLFALSPIYVDDLFLYLTFGRMLFHRASTGQGPVGFGEIDPLIFTIPDHRWTLWHEWLTYALHYGAYEAGGYAGTLILRGALVTAIVLIVWRTTTRAGLAVFWSVALTALSLAAASPRCFRDRSSVITDLLTVLLLYILSDAATARRWKWLVPALFLVWVQFHSGYVIAWFFVGLFYVSHFPRWSPKERRDWFVVGAGCLLATIVNPEFVRGALWPVRAIFGGDWGVLGQITEFAPTWSTPSLPLYFKIFFTIFVCAGVALTAIAIRWRGWFPFFAALTLAYLGLRYTRMVAFTGFGLGLLVAAARFDFMRRAPRALNFAAYAAVISLTVILLVYPARGLRFLITGDLLHASVPVKATEFLKTLPPGHVFNEWSLGSYLAWELDGRQKIAAHGFISDPKLVEERIYRFSVTREGWKEIIEDGGVRYFFLRRQTFEESRAAAWVQELSGPSWRGVYVDGAAVIFERAD